MARNYLGGVLPVGSVIHSMLTTAQFQSEMGSNWVLADGSSCTGTKYASITGATTLPDMRGRFLRGKSHASGNNPDGDLSLGTYSADKYGSHEHQERFANSSNGGASAAFYYPGSGGDSRLTIVAGNASGGGGTLTSLNTVASGSNETAPRAITVNIFIRVN